ncbi:MAG TPA: LysM domain-containing protein [Thermoleophilaceae bacterium]|nr:LysM domain-containing protein [Thermoleophilaceae bacterium]
MRERPALDLRILAPVSVGVFAIAVIAVLIASGALSGGDSGAPASGQADEPRRDRTERRPRPREGSGGPATYTVQAGDTLGSIAEDTGVSVERLQEMNPQLDPQTLTAGQRINLRE